MQFESFTTFNLAILVLALGNWLNSRIKILRDFNIPEPVTSGLLVCVVTALLYSFVGLEISFNLATRDFLLLYFFASIGLNSDIKTLWAGGIPLLILVALTIGYMLLQNLTGIAVATSLGLGALVGLLVGSVSLLGGHGTSIAWAPTFAEKHGIPNASEIGIACATHEPCAWRTPADGAALPRCQPAPLRLLALAAIILTNTIPRILRRHGLQERDRWRLCRMFRWASFSQCLS